ncbi:MAG TPA: SCO family protein [Balneolaceae bacterium]
MISTIRSFFICLLFSGVLISCNSPDALYDLSDESYSLLNTDSTTVIFPDDFKGEIAVISFVYTHCPDVCTIITANMKNIQSKLQDTSGVQFVEISFDPERDTPSVLKEYKELYRLNDQFTFLTGDTATVHSLLNKLNIVARKTRIDSLQQDSSEYFMKHSNTIYLMDESGRIRAEYPASFVPPKNVIEDLKKLR